MISKESVYLMPTFHFLGVHMVKNPPAMQETQDTWIWSLSWEDPLEEGMGTHSSNFPWRIPRTEELGRLKSMGSQRIGQDGVTNKVHTGASAP